MNLKVDYGVLSSAAGEIIAIADQIDVGVQKATSEISKTVGDVGSPDLANELESLKTQMGVSHALVVTSLREQARWLQLAVDTYGQTDTEIAQSIEVVR